jgi:zinc protease
MLRLLFLLSLFLLPYTQAQAAFNSKHFKLDNGLQVVVIPNHKIGAVTHMVWYRVGAIDEAPGKSGIAHLLEHFMFKGTEKFPKGVFSKRVAQVGGNDNAFTSHDYTAYYQTVPKDKLEMVMEMEADRMRGVQFTDQESMEKERQVVVEERLLRTDNKPIARLSEQMRAALFRNHFYQRPVIGWMHEIKSLTLKDAETFYQQYYAPNNAILVVAGAVDEKEVRTLADKYYGVLDSKASIERPYKALKEPTKTVPVEIVLKDDKVGHPQWVRYYKTFSQHTENREYSYALTLLSEYLSEGTTSKLYQDLVVDKKIAQAVNGYYDDMNLGPSVYSLQITPKKKEDIGAIESHIEAEFDKIKAEGLTPEVLERLKRKLIDQTVYAQEDIKTLAIIYGQSWVAGLNSEYVESWEKNIDAVTNEDIKKAALLTLNKAQSVTGRLER